MSIDDVVQKEETGLLKKIGKALYNGFYTALAVASSYISYGLVGINGILSGLAFTAGTYIVNKFKKVKTKYADIIKEYIIGTVVGSVGSKLYDAAAKYIPNVALKGKILRGVAGVAVANPIFTGAYVATDHLVKKDFNPFGMVDRFKSDYWPVLKDTTKWLGLGVALTINGYLGGYPGIIAMDTGYRVIAGTAGKGK